MENLNVNKIAEAIREGLKAEGRGSVGGCGRAYVSLSGGKKVYNAVKKAAEKVGILYLKEAYGTYGEVLYVGYDNADGHAWAKAKAIAENLKEIGISAYEIGVSD